MEGGCVYGWPRWASAKPTIWLGSGWLENFHNVWRRSVFTLCYYTLLKLCVSYIVWHCVALACGDVLPTCTSSQQKCVHNTQKMSYSPSFSMGASSKPLNLRLWLIHCVIIWAWLWDRQFQQENGASRIDIDQHSHQWTMHLLLQRSVNRKIFQNVYFRPHFHFLICLVFPGIPLVKTTKMSKIHICIF